jgi:hypothetical protein
VRRGFALSSLVPEAAITEAIATALLETLRRCARKWSAYLVGFWADAEDIALEWSETVGAVSPDPDLVSVQIVRNFDGIPGTKGMIAYHDTDEWGRPRCRISYDAVLAEGGTFTGPGGVVSAISHELHECLVDPSCRRTVSAVFGITNPDGKDEPLEVCDRLQGDDYCEPTSPDIWVANACTPAYYLRKGSPVSVREDVQPLPELRAWEQLPGGYHEELGPAGASHVACGQGMTNTARERVTQHGPRGGLRWST